MDRNTIIGIVLLFLIFAGFSVYNNSVSKKGFKTAVSAAQAEVEKGNYERARTYYVDALRFRPNDTEVLEQLRNLNSKLGIGTVTNAQDSLIADAPRQSLNEQTVAADSSQYGIFGSSASGTNEFITLENDVLELKISMLGGRVYSARLKNYVTHDSLPLILFSGDSTVFGFTFPTEDARIVETNKLYFRPESEQRTYSVTTEPESVILRLHASEDKYIEYKYTLAPGKYSVDFDIAFQNLQGIMQSRQDPLTLDWKMYVPQQEKGRDNEDAYTTIKHKEFEGDVQGLSPRSRKESDADELPRTSWIAFQDQFFSSVLIAENYFLSGTISSTRTVASKEYLRYFTTRLMVPMTQDQDSKIALKFYFGPNHISTLRKEGYQLDKIVFLGRNIIGWISRFVIIPIFNWLEKYIGSYGLIILILTILIKIVLFPLTFKSFQSTAKMAVLKPQVEEINKKFPKQDEAIKKQQATMDLYKRAGVNPLGGCLPTLLQFPILFAMFRFFPVSIELRQEPFLWATDLSTYDSILNLPFTIPMYGDHISLFTLLMTLSSLLTIKMTSSSPGSDQPGMKIMMWMMPIMFMFILNKFSAGLTYYYFLANLLTWAQNIISKRFIDEDKVLATLEANKKKPVPKSKWQQRLEDAAKQRGLKAPKR